nr:hypothetical protein [Tanacetum cinerariifolium]
KKLLDSVMLDKLKLDGEVEIDEEEATEEVIRSYKMIREKNDPRVFVLPIRIKEKFYTHDLADTGSNINKFYVAVVRNKHENDSDDEEDYSPQETLNPFRKFYVWKKMVALLGSLPVLLQHNQWIQVTLITLLRKVMVMGSGMIKPLDSTTLRELISSNGRLTAEEPTPDNQRVAILRPHAVLFLIYMIGWVAWIFVKESWKG